MSTISSSNQIAQQPFGEISESSIKPNYFVADPMVTPSGFTNYSVREMRVMAIWKKLVTHIYELYGFTKIDLPPVEYACNLQKTGGVEKQIFGVSRLQDGSLTKLGLPFDRTVPLARFIANNHQSMKFPYSRQDVDWSWRGEHASAGRYRAFIQADVDVVAPTLSTISDAQSIVAIVKALQALKVPKFHVYLNHVDVAKDFLRNAQIPESQYKDALRVIDKLKPDNKEEVVKELVDVIASVNEEQAYALLDAMSYRGPLNGFTFPYVPTEKALAGLENLKQIQSYMDTMGVDPETHLFVPNLARGLNYYTGVVFETFMPNREKYGSIASGGRYDDLISDFNPNLKLQGVGGSIGLTRLFDVMKIENLFDLSKETTAEVFVGYRTEHEQNTAIALATALREKNISVEMQQIKMKVKDQLAFADQKGMEFTALVMNNDEIVIKDMSVKKKAEGRTDQLTFTSIKDAVNGTDVLEGLSSRVESVRKKAATESALPGCPQEEKGG